MIHSKIYEFVTFTHLPVDKISAINTKLRRKLRQTKHKYSYIYITSHLHYIILLMLLGITLLYYENLGSFAVLHPFKCVLLYFLLQRLVAEGVARCGVNVVPCVVRPVKFPNHHALKCALVEVGVGVHQRNLSQGMEYVSHKINVVSQIGYSKRNFL